jgi:hypothetical protein
MGAGSRFAAAIEETFGSFPLSLCTEHIPVLMAMANTYGGQDEDNPYLELTQLINRHDTISIWTEY